MRFAGLIVAIVALGGCAHSSRWDLDYVVLPLGQIDVLATSPGVTILPMPDRQRFFPTRARDRGISGIGRVRCTVGVRGALESCQVMQERPAGLNFGDATVRIARRGKADLSTAPAGSQVELSLAYRVEYWVDLDCDLTVERVARDCRVSYQQPRDAAVGERIAREAEGKAPPAGVSTVHPGRARWRVSMAAPIEGE